MTSKNNIYLAILLKINFNDTCIYFLLKGLTMYVSFKFYLFLVCKLVKPSYRLLKLYNIKPLDHNSLIVLDHNSLIVKTKHMLTIHIYVMYVLISKPSGFIRHWEPCFVWR